MVFGILKLFDTHSITSHRAIVVGADGTIRATSPPFPGVTESGTYTIGLLPASMPSVSSIVKAGTKANAGTILAPLKDLTKLTVLDFSFNQIKSLTNLNNLTKD